MTWGRGDLTKEGSGSMRRRIVWRAIGGLLSLVLLGTVGARSMDAAESVKTAALGSASPDPSPSFLLTAPPEAQAIAPALRRVVQVVRASGELADAIKQVRATEDSVRSKLAATHGEIELLAQERQQLTGQLSVLEQAQQERLGTLRRGLETRMDAELAQARDQILQDHETDFAQEIQAFASRQQASFDEAIQKELELKERELTQLAQEVELETRGLVTRLSRLEVDEAVANSLQRSAEEALARRRVQLDAERTRLIAERNAQLTKQRDEFAVKIRQQQAAEVQRRLTLKEAGLRSAMAEILSKARLEETEKSGQVKRRLESLEERQEKLARQQGLLAARMEALTNELDAKVSQAKTLDGQRQASLARLEAIFHNPTLATHQKALAWLGQTIPQLPPEISDEIQALQQRMTALAQKEHELEEQRRVLRERQQALQLARELELQYQRNRLREQQEREAKSRRAEELLDKASQFATRGAFDEALKVIAQAQTIGPPQMTKIRMMREEILAARAQAERNAQAAHLEHIFTRGMQAFETGNYEQAVALFEQVIAQEAKVAHAAPAGAPPE